MKILIRIIQFMLNEIVEIFSSVWIFLMGIGFYVILPILTFFAFLALIIGKNWNGFIGILLFTFIACAVFGIIKFIQVFLNFILGFFLNESEENKKIYKEYKQWYESVRNQEYERRKRTQEEYQRQQHNKQNNSNSRFNYKSTNNNGIIQKFEKCLDFLGIDKNGEITDRIIHKAFLKKMKVVHPDKNIGKDTTAQAQEIKAMEDFLKEQLEYYLMQKEKK